MKVSFVLRTCAAALAAIFASGQAAADIVVSDLVVELQTGKEMREDVEVFNSGTDRTYLVVEPSEIVGPGTPGEQRVHDPDPEKLGLLVSPARMILEPGQRKIVRIAAIAPAGDRERVYRVTVKPVVGSLESEQSGLKILVGYDVLVLIRPNEPKPDISVSRSGDSVTFHNDGNVSVEMFDGRECDATGKTCSDLPGKRLYAGASWTEQLKPGRHPEYTLRSPGQSVHKTF